MKHHVRLPLVRAMRLFALMTLQTIGLASQTVCAQTHSTSGFMTLSYSLSDSEDRYLRSIDNRGSLRNGTIVGFQVDSKFSETLSTTVQVAAFESDRKDNSTRVDLKWANINYRPGNSWLFRVGKLRNNLVLDAQNLDIGATYTPARLPPEVYFSTNLLEYYGGSTTRYFELNRKTEMSVELFAGRTDTYIRLLSLPKSPSSTVRYANTPLDLIGGTVRVDSGPWSAQLNLSRYRSADNDFPLAVDIQAAGLRGPVGPVTARLEYFRAQYPKLSDKPTSNSGAIIVEKTFGKYTPYLTAAYSDYEELNTGRNHSTAIGLAYDLQVLTKLKAEVSRVRTGADSFLVDSVPADREINLMTLSFNRIF